MEEIGLFPLGLVLLPTEQVPLHIFEPRYRELIGETLETGLPFGIVYADDDGLRRIGTLATVTEVVELTLLETFQFLKSCHRRAPFLFFNGNTFAEIGRALANALLSDLPLVRRKEASSAVAHFITGVLDQDLMVAAIDSLWKAASFAPGDRVKTLRGTTHGVVLRLADDGRVVWRQDGGSAELVALPEGLLRLQ